MVPLLFVVTIFEMDSDGERRFALLCCGKPEKILAGRIGWPAFPRVSASFYVLTYLMHEKVFEH